MSVSQETPNLLNLAQEWVWPEMPDWPDLSKLVWPEMPDLPEVTWPDDVLSGDTA